MDDFFSQAFSQNLFSSLHKGSDQVDGQDLLKHPVRDFLDRENVVEVSRDCLLEEACDLMIEKQIRYLVVTQNKEIKGIFSSFDALGLLDSKHQEASGKNAQAENMPKAKAQQPAVRSQAEAKPLAEPPKAA